jgi:hypothetical protein
MSALFGKMRRKRSVRLRKWIRKRNNLGAASVCMFISEVVREETESYKNQVTVSDHSVVACTSIGSCATLL